MSAVTEQSNGFGHLTSPPEACGAVPIATRPQLLPLGSLRPKDFERLCFRLARLDAAVESCRIYGVDGQAQQGIDLYVRRSDGSYMVIQCKRSSDDFTPAEITSAVDTFLDRDWAANAKVFVLAVTANLERTQLADRIEEERTKLDARGIRFDVWDELGISAQMKDHPRLVDDFFGREAVKVFLGPEAALALGDRLDADEVVRFRTALGALYREVFGRLERGVHGDDRNVALPERFVLPDVLVGSDVAMPPPAPQAPQRQAAQPAPAFRIVPGSGPDVTAGLRNSQLRPADAGYLSDSHATRVQVTDWLGTGNWHVVVGVPGSGKSALLRTLVLDAFADAPRFISNLDRWHDLLPVWLPFSFWTHAAQKRPDAASVLDGARAWLDAYDHGHLWPLVQKALRDERVLLVIDGFDEWASPDLARLCVDRLEVFAGTKHVNVMASSRPFSTADLPLDRQRWRRAELAPLNQEQRWTFISRWLAPLIDEPELSKEAASWAAEIDSATHLRELSHLPLFLLLLLRTREQRTEFPEDLHAVLEEAVTRLVGEHRRRKIDAAGAADAFPSTADVRRVSAATAHQMHLHSTLSISDEELREQIRRTLTDSIGYPAAEAHAMASTLVNSLSPGMGLMIRPAPDETRFFHRSILEFLAAERMLAQSSADQIALFQEHLTDRRWAQVLRFLVRGLVRPHEIAAIFTALDPASTDDALLREQLNLLAADVVVNAGATDAPTRRRLLDRVVQEVDAGERTRHRAQLVDRLVAGLARPEIHAELLNRFEGWLRAVPREIWASVLNTASHWAPDHALLNMLWHALLSEADQVQRVAARVLGTRFAGDNDVATQLAELANTTRLPHRQAAAIEALSIGWARHDALDSLIASGQTHPEFAVRHAAIAADLRRGNITDARRSTLIELLDHAPTLSSWSDGLMELMFTHFPDDQVIFEHYVPHADPTTTDQIRYGEVPAMYLILKGYTARPEAKEFFLKFIAEDRRDFPDTPSNLTDRVPWKEIGETYGTDDDVLTAIERLVDEYESSSFHNRDLYFCAQVARTPKVQSKLIASIENGDGFGASWAIRALIEGWPDDPGVRDTLRRLIGSAGDPLPEGALWCLSDIVTDSNTALEILASGAGTAKNQGAAVVALSEIVRRGADRSDPRATSILDRALRDAMTNSWVSPEAALYAYFPDHPGVRQLALARIDDRDVPMDSIAYGFRADHEIRQHVAERLKPLSAALRGRLVEGLADASPTDAGVTQLLSRYDNEPDPTVRLIAAIAYAGRLVATDAVTETAVDAFTEQVRATGSDLYERRSAGFGALAVSRRLDRLTDLRERAGTGLIDIHHSSLGDTSLFFRLICRYWEDVKASLGSDLPGRFGYSGAMEFWSNLLTVAHDYPATHDDLAILLDQQPVLASSVGGIAYLSKVEPGSDRLWDAITRVLQGARAIAYADIQPAWPALNILEDQFATDPRTSTWLDTQLLSIKQTGVEHDGRLYISLPSFGAIAALARLRPEHPETRELLTRTQRDEDQRWHTFHEWTELAAASTPDARGFVDLAVEISKIVDINDLFPEYIHRPLTARLRRDSALAADVAALVPTLSGAAFGVTVRLLSLSASLDGPLVAHLRSRLSTLHNADSDTFDPLIGQVMHSELLILDLLDTSEA